MNRLDRIFRHIMDYLPVYSVLYVALFIVGLALLATPC